MEYSFFFDADLGQNHIAKHDVSESDIDEFFTETRVIEVERKDGSFVAFGRLESGRYLHVVFRKTGAQKRHIITAFDLQDGEIISILDGLE